MRSSSHPVAVRSPFPPWKTKVWTSWWQDNGVGIAEEDQQRVFTPFVQLDASGLQRYEGAGLGLALVKSLAEMHDATVALDSTEGEGTTITVHFPEAALVPRSNSN